MRTAKTRPLVNVVSEVARKPCGGCNGATPAGTDILSLAIAHAQAITDAAVAGISSGTPSVKKSADTSRTSTTTFAADPDLQISLAANTVYHIRIRVDYDPGSSGLGSADFKWRLTGPASPTRVSILASENAAGSLTSLVETPLNAYPTSRTLSTGGDQTAGMILIDMMISNGANAGTFSFDWAQNASNVSATKVLKGSYLEYRTTA